MKIDTKSRYGLRAMFDMAYHGGGQTTQVKEIARRQKISCGYLEQIFQDLKRAGLVNTRRGPKGGYSLAKKPQEITIREIILATGTDLVILDCLAEAGEKSRDCSLQQRCITHKVWSEATRRMQDYFGSVTLKDLCDRAGAMGLTKEQDQRFVYYI